MRSPCVNVGGGVVVVDASVVVEMVVSVSEHGAEAPPTTPVTQSAMTVMAPSTSTRISTRRLTT